MTSLPFKKIDAFTGASSSGNPAGVVYLHREGELTSGQMQQIAAECKGWVSEVGFAARLDQRVYWLRYYSSEREVDFCGHATVAIAYDLIKNDAALQGEQNLRLCTKNADVVVTNRIVGENAVYISAPPAVYKKQEIPPIECAKALRAVNTSGVTPKATINAGLDTLIVELSSLEQVLSLKPDPEELRKSCVLHNIDIVLVYSNEASTRGSSYRTRVFAPRFGYLEDPATGSGNSAFGYFLIDKGMWKAGTLIIEQNGSCQNPNYVKLTLSSGEDGKTRVLFGGSARVRFCGEYFL